MRRIHVFVFAKFMSDSAWYFYLFWLPKYLYDVRGFDTKHMSYYAWIPYAASGVGSFPGGWLSSALLKRGRSLDFFRKFALGLSALYAGRDVGPLRTCRLGVGIIQHCIFLPAVVVRIDYDLARRHLPASCRRICVRPHWGRHWRRRVWRRRGIPSRARIRLWNIVFCRWNLSS